MRTSALMLVGFWAVTALAAAALRRGLRRRAVRPHEALVCALVYLALWAILYPSCVGQRTMEAHAAWRREHGGAEPGR